MQACLVPAHREAEAVPELLDTHNQPQEVEGGNRMTTLDKIMADVIDDLGLEHRRGFSISLSNEDCWRVTCTCGWWMCICGSVAGSEAANERIDTRYAQHKEAR